LLKEPIPNLMILRHKDFHILVKGTYEQVTIGDFFEKFGKKLLVIPSAWNYVGEKLVILEHVDAEERYPSLNSMRLGDYKEVEVQVNELKFPCIALTRHILIGTFKACQVKQTLVLSGDCDVSELIYEFYNRKGP
jgi:hypothetical protein